MLAAEPAAPLPLLYLCRHGQTDWNAEGRIQGQRDVPLNDHGRQQARRNGVHLRQALGKGAPGFDFLASPLSRTRETMEIIRGELGLARSGFPTDARLMEMHFGDWQGHTLEEIESAAPGTLATRERDKWNYRPSGDEAENYEMLLQRVRPVFEALERPTLVVAHGGITRVFLRHWAGTAAHEAAHGAILQDRILRWQDGEAHWV